MPDTRTHRGPAPEDARLFNAKAWPSLREATQDLCWLLSRGYALHSASELVGNRYALTARQRLAVSRSAGSSEARQRRQQHEVEPAQLSGQDLWIDGLNVLTVVEAALAGGVLLLGCDGCFRDMASVHARHHHVEETIPALRLLGTVTGDWGVRCCRWWLDRPVANTGRLKQTMLELAAASGWDWQVELVFNPDKVLTGSAEVVATADSAILDRCQRWVNLAHAVITQHVPQAQIVDLRVGHSEFQL